MFADVGHAATRSHLSGVCTPYGRSSRPCRTVRARLPGAYIAGDNSSRSHRQGTNPSTTSGDLRKAERNWCAGHGQLSAIGRYAIGLCSGGEGPPQRRTDRARARASAHRGRGRPAATRARGACRQVDGLASTGCWSTQPLSAGGSRCLRSASTSSSARVTWWRHRPHIGSAASITWTRSSVSAADLADLDEY
jgi:hypothetical protein